MKKTILLLFLFLTINGIAQKNELNIVYQLTSFDKFNDHISLNYFRNVGANKAMGVQANFQWYLEDSNYNYENIYAGSLDFLNRRYFNKSNKFRFWTEFGISAMRQVKLKHKVNFCYCTDPISTLPFDEERIKTNHFGFVAGLGIDVEIFKTFHTGVAFDFKTYFSNELEERNTVNDLSSLNIILGYKF